MSPLTNQDSAFLLEEVFQLLRESLEQDPFKPGKHQPTKKHIACFRNLLGPEFSFLLAETGNLFYAALHTAKIYIDQACNMQYSDTTQAKQIYSRLLLTSQLIMSTGIQSEQTINAVLDLNQLTNENAESVDEIHSVIDNTLNKLQKIMCKLASP